MHLTVSPRGPVYTILLDFITLICSEEFKLYEVPHYAVSFLCSGISTLLGQHILLSTYYSDTLNLCSSIRLKTKFHIHTKQQAKLQSHVFNIRSLDRRREDKRFWTE